MLSRLPIRPLIGFLFLCFTNIPAFAYWTQTYGFQGIDSIVMQLELGPTNVVLEDGSKTWDGSAANALSLWNPHLETIPFGWVINSTATEQSGDGLNSVFFSDSVFGEDFGEGVLAVTVYLDDDGVEVEADVVVNQIYNYNSYRGALKPGDPASRVYDIHRIFLHEFGHVLGLGHPDESGQLVEAIMNSVIGNLDHLTEDDIAGAVDLYGIKIFPEVIKATVGQPISYQLPTNIAGVSFEAVNLPAGLTLNTRTGVISGWVAISGQYLDPIVTVHGTKTSASSSLYVYVSPDPPENLRAEYFWKANNMIVDDIRDRVYVSISDPPSIAIIDGATLSLIKTIATESEPFGVSISPDGNKLFIVEYQETNSVVGVIDLPSLTSLPSLPFVCADVAAGLDNRLYVTTPWGVEQIDSTTGADLGPVPDVQDGALKLSPDRKTLYCAQISVTPPTLWAVDVSSPTPVLLQQTTFSQFMNGMDDFKVSHDGTFLCAAIDSDGQVSKLLASDLTTSVAEYKIPDFAWGGPMTGQALALSPDDTTLFVTANYFWQTAAIDLFDVATQKYLRSISAGPFIPSKFRVDPTGQYLFASSETSDFVSQLRVYTTGLPSTPLHPPKPKSLLNVSTRLQSQTGDNVLIGGFIITGEESKQIAVRGVAPSLPVDGALADPTIGLYDSTGKLIVSNDNWNSNRSSVLASGLAPANEYESALIITLSPGNYTVILSGADEGSGVALVEAYDLTPDTSSSLANISTRGNVEAGDNVMIGGFIIGPDAATKVLMRAIGPSLAKTGVSGALQDPVLELHGSDGDLIFSNDNWRSTQQADIIATGIPPTDDRESAIIATLQPGNYTAIVRGQADSNGVALVEIYNLDYASTAR